MMWSYRPNSLIAALALAATLQLAPAAVAQDKAPKVVELYTSQGCYSCPPADALLGELVTRDDIIGLSFHVDYWDYIGWKDPFATADGTARQRVYAGTLNKRYVYTPQMVVGGAVDVVGSDRGALNRALDTVENDSAIKLALQQQRGDDGKLSVLVPAADYDGEAEIWLVAYDDKHTTEILRGENRGKTLSYFNVVRDIKRVGTWSGAPVTIDLPAGDMASDGRDGCVIIVQGVNQGPILGATKLRL